MPDKYVLIVEPLSFRVRASQSMNAKVLASINGSSMFIAVSLLHFSNIDFAVLYALQVLLVTPRFPHCAMDSVTSLGRFRFLSDSLVQPPACPYLDDPGAGVGVKPAC